jgi:hypothetical protein
MTDLSEVQSIVNAEYDCNPGAMFANAGCVSTTTADLYVRKLKKGPPPTVRMVPVIDLTRHGAYYERRVMNRKLCHGHIEAAELYQEIIDLWQPKDGKPRVENIRSGCFWWGRSRENWAKKMAWTERQVKHRISQLRDFGLIETCMAKTPYNMLQVRPLVADGAASLPGTPDSSNYPSLTDAESLMDKGSQEITCPQAHGHNLAAGAETKIGHIKALGLGVGLKEVGSLNSASQKPLATGTSELHQAEAAGVMKQTTPVELPPAKTPDPDLLPEKHLDGEKKLAWVIQWETPTGSETPVPLEPDQVGMLKFVGESMAKQGLYLKDVIVFLQTGWNWTAFVQNTCVAVGVSTHPSLSDNYALDFFAKYWDHAANQMVEKQKSDAYWLAKAKTMLGVDQPVEAPPADKPATLEEIEKAEAESAAKHGTVPAVLLEPEPVELAAQPVVTSTATASLETGCPVIEYAVLPLVPDVPPSFEVCQAWYLENLARVQAEAAKAKQKAKHYHA